jgi:hypothetical protein
MGRPPHRNARSSTGCRYQVAPLIDPDLCPSWCVVDHVQAQREGLEREDVLRHVSNDLGGHLPDLVNHSAQRLDRHGGGGWRLQLQQEGEPQPFGGYPVLELAVTGAGHAEIPLPLTTAEARRLAAQLLHLADAEDLHRYDNVSTEAFSSWLPTRG